LAGRSTSPRRRGFAAASTSALCVASDRCARRARGLQGHPKQCQIADDVQDLVPDKLVREPQPIRSACRASSKQWVIQRAAANQVCASQGFDFFDKAKGAGGSDVSRKRSLSKVTDRCWTQSADGKIDRAIDS